jgi:hypothetical protein
LQSANSFAASNFGESKIILEKTWTVAGHAGKEFSLDGFFVINNSNQKVVNTSTTPPVGIVQDANGSIRIRYNGTIEKGGDATVKAIATIVIDYNTALSSDITLSAVSALSKNATTNLTVYSAFIANEAKKLSVPSSALNTLRNLTWWVHTNIHYNESYFSLVKSAIEVYQERQGVCVEYTHLLMSMAAALGFENRYVTGYAKTSEWQPHAWVEIYLPGQGWLPLDATFNEAGVLDNSHIAMSYGTDHGSVFDIVTSTSKVSIMIKNKLNLVTSNNDPKGFSVKCVLDSNSTKFGVSVENNRSVYAFGSYDAIFPAEINDRDSALLLLAPNEIRSITYKLNDSFFDEGFSYLIPIYVSLNDATCNQSHNFTVTSKIKDDTSDSNAVKNNMCAMVVGFFSSIAFYLFYFGRCKKW